MTEDKANMDPLERLFDDVATAQAPEVSADFLARVLSDAEAAQREFEAHAESDVSTPGIWSRLIGAVGGWPSVGGLVTATCAGIWIGYNPPAALDDTVLSYLELGGLVQVEESEWSLDPWESMGLEPMSEG